MIGDGRSDDDGKIAAFWNICGAWSYCYRCSRTGCVPLLHFRCVSLVQEAASHKTSSNISIGCFIHCTFVEVTSIGCFMHRTFVAVPLEVLQDSAPSLFVRATSLLGSMLPVPPWRSTSFLTLQQIHL